MIQNFCCRVAAACSMAVLFGCAAPAPYGTHGHNGGFNEQKLADNVIWVGYYAYKSTPEEQIISYWLHRCAELTVQNGYSYFALVPDRGPWKPGRKDQLVPMRGAEFRTVDLIRVRGRTGGFVIVPGYGGAAPPPQIWHKDGTIGQYETAEDAASPGHSAPLHAPTVLAKLGDYVKSGGAIAPPPAQEVIDAATVRDPSSPTPSPAMPAGIRKPI